MSRFRRWILLAWGLALAAPAAAGPLDLPELDAGAVFDGAPNRPEIGGVPVYQGDPAPAPRRPFKAGIPPRKIDLPASFVPPKPKPFYDDPKRQEEFLNSIKAGENYGGSPYYLGDSLGPGLENAFNPVLRGVSATGDYVFGFLTRAMPGKASEDFSTKPSTASADAFHRIFHEKEGVFLRDMYNTYPHASGENGLGQPGDYQRYRDWQNWAGNRQLDVLANSFGDWAIDRYRLQAAGEKFGKDMKNPANWTPGVIALSVIGGGVMGYFFGIQQPIYYKQMRMHLDLHSADAVVRAAQNGGDVGRVAGVEIGPRDDHWPVAYFNEEIKNGKWVTNTYGLKLSRRFHELPWD